MHMYIHKYTYTNKVYLVKSCNEQSCVAFWSSMENKNIYACCDVCFWIMLCSNFGNPTFWLDSPPIIKGGEETLMGRKE